MRRISFVIASLGLCALAFLILQFGVLTAHPEMAAERPAGKAWAELRAASSAHILKAQGTNLPEGLSPAEWSEIQKQIRDSEYELAPAEPGTREVPRTAWQALNRAQDLRVYFSEEGIQVVPRREPEPSWEWGLTLKSYGYQGRTRPV